MKNFLVSSTNSMNSWLSNLLWSSENSENEREMLVDEETIQEIPWSSKNSESEREMVLTEYLIEEIILRLPIKSFVRCKSLSKKWHFLISESPSFRRIYFSRMIDTSPHMLGFFCSRPLHIRLCGEGSSPPAVKFLPTCNEGFMLKRGEETWGAPPFDDTLSFMSQGNLSIMASSGGFLLCSLQSMYPLDYFICNPMTKQWVALPKPSFTRNIVVHGLAICQDESTACYLPLHLIKYKVFRVTWKQPAWAQPTDAAIIEIFSSELHQWKVLHLNSTLACFGPRIRNKMVMPLQEEEEEGVFAFYSTTLTINSAIAAVVYDPRKDYLDLIEVPGGQVDNGTTDCWGLSLGRIHYVRHDWSHLQIWTLDKIQEYRRREWTLKQTVNIQIPLQNYGELLGPLIRKYYIEAFHPTNPDLLFLNYSSLIVLFNMEDSSMQLLSNRYQLADNFFLYAWPHWPPFFH